MAIYVKYWYISIKRNKEYNRRTFQCTILLYELEMKLDFYCLYHNKSRFYSGGYKMWT